MEKERRIFLSFHIFHPTGANALLDCITWPLEAASEEGAYHIQWLGSSFQAGCGSRASVGLSVRLKPRSSGAAVVPSMVGAVSEEGAKGSGAGEAERLRRHHVV